MPNPLRLQFRLWHLVLAMTLISVALAWLAELRQKVGRQKATLRVLQMHGVSFDAKVASPWKEFLAGGPVDQTMTVRFYRLRPDSGSQGPFGPEGNYVPLHPWGPASFPELRQAMEQLPGITVLSVDGSRLSGHAGDLIPASPTITYLALTQTGIRSAELAVLSRLPNLKQLSLRRTPIGDDGLRFVSPLNDLEFLDLGSTDVSDEGMSHLARLTKLKTLRLENTHLTDDGLRKLGSLRNLEEFDLGMTLVTEESVPLLAEMGVRTWIGVPGEWRPEAVERLRKSLPSTSFVRESSYLLKDRADAKARRSVAGASGHRSE